MESKVQRTISINKKINGISCNRIIEYTSCMLTMMYLIHTFILSLSNTCNHPCCALKRLDGNE